MNTASSIKAEVVRESLLNAAAPDMYAALGPLIQMAKLTPGAGMAAVIRNAEQALRKARGEAA